MKYCSHCGIEITPETTICPNCGSRVELCKPNKIIHKLFSQKKLLAIICIVIAVAFIALLYLDTNISPYEELAIENCNALKSMLKKPDSFRLYDDILVYEDSDYGTIMFIPYSGENSFGNEVRSIAQFSNGNNYAGDFQKLDREDFDSDHAYNEYLLIGFSYAFAIAVGDDDFSDFTHIDSSKIMRKID